MSATEPAASSAPVDAEHPPTPTDADFAGVFKRGAIVGTPLSFVALAVLVWVAAPEPVVLLAALWPALTGGWYFGAMVVLAGFELSGQGARVPLPRRLVRPA
jgi:hypothetical protein